MTKAKVLVVGKVTDYPDGQTKAHGWSFSFAGLDEGAALTYLPDGSQFLCGYSIDELRLLSQGQSQ